MHINKWIKESVYRRTKASTRTSIESQRIEPPCRPVLPMSGTWTSCLLSINHSCAYQSHTVIGPKMLRLPRKDCIVDLLLLLLKATRQAY